MTDFATVARPPAPRRPRFALPGVAALTARGFGALSRARGGRAFHHDGVVCRGQYLRDPAAPPSGAEILDRDEPADVVVRLSRSFGVPQPLPDSLGCAIRWPNAYGVGRHQDLVLVSTGRLPGTRHALLAARDFTACVYTSLLPLAVGGERRMVAATLDAGGAERTTDGVGRAVERGGAHLTLLTASVLGAWEPVGVIELDEVADDLPDVRFNPYNSRGDLRPTGLVHALRDPAYTGSQSEAVD